MTQSSKPILIAGPTASGKSQLALQLAAHCDGLIINADALQVYDCWSILTARPSSEDLKFAPHALYGHVSCAHSYSVGSWLRDVAAVLQHDRRRPIIIGGTGLYFTTLTIGLADIPNIPNVIREKGNVIRKTDGAAGFISELRNKDPETLQNLDQNNPMRLQRAWEVLTATGKGLAAWQSSTSPPVLPKDQCDCYVLNVETPVLDARIATRFDTMIAAGAMDEVAAVTANGWDAALPSSRAIGAAELVAVQLGEMAMSEAIASAKLATRQYAKRQRSWFRNRMPGWQQMAFTDESQRNQAFAQILNH
jgi:tRNA dimethylallyltransferase